MFHSYGNSQFCMIMREYSNMTEMNIMTNSNDNQLEMTQTQQYRNDHQTNAWHGAPGQISCIASNKADFFSDKTGKTIGQPSCYPLVNYKTSSLQTKNMLSRCLHRTFYGPSLTIAARWHKKIIGLPFNQQWSGGSVHCHDCQGATHQRKGY